MTEMMKQPLMTIILFVILLPIQFANAETDLPECPDSGLWDKCFGTYMIDDGSVYVGEWKDDNFNGKGTYTTIYGDEYIGDFRDSDFNGQGTLTLSDGTVQQGLWKDGGLVETKEEEPQTTVDGIEKVLFAISDASDSYQSVIQKDDMDDFVGYRNLVGCDYAYSVKNQTNKKIKIDNFTVSLDTNFKKYGEVRGSCGKFDKCHLIVNIDYDYVIKQGEKVIIPHYAANIENPLEPSTGFHADLGVTKERLTNDEVRELFTKYGCSAQKGKVYLTGPGVMADTIVFFSKKHGISNGETYNFISFEEGEYPLKKGF